MKNLITLAFTLILTSCIEDGRIYNRTMIEPVVMTYETTFGPPEVVLRDSNQQTFRISGNAALFLASKYNPGDTVVFSQ